MFNDIICSGTEEESSDRHSSDDEGGDIEGDGRRFVWRISSEQRLHYISQFHLLQPDTNGLVPGKIARCFFIAYFKINRSNPF